MIPIDADPFLADPECPVFLAERDGKRVFVPKGLRENGADMGPVLRDVAAWMMAHDFGLDLYIPPGNYLVQSSDGCGRPVFDDSGESMG